MIEITIIWNIIFLKSWTGCKKILRYIYHHKVFKEYFWKSIVLWTFMEFFEFFSVFFSNAKIRNVMSYYVKAEFLCDSRRSSFNKLKKSNTVRTILRLLMVVTLKLRKISYSKLVLVHLLTLFSTILPVKHQLLFISMTLPIKRQLWEDTISVLFQDTCKISIIHNDKHLPYSLYVFL